MTELELVVSTSLEDVDAEQVLLLPLVILIQCAHVFLEAGDAPKSWKGGARQASGVGH